MFPLLSSMRVRVFSWTSQRSWKSRPRKPSRQPRHSRENLFPRNSSKITGKSVMIFDPNAKARLCAGAGGAAACFGMDRAGSGARTARHEGDTFTECVCSDLCQLRLWFRLNRCKWPTPTKAIWTKRFNRWWNLHCCQFTFTKLTSSNSDQSFTWSNVTNRSDLHFEKQRTPKTSSDDRMTLPVNPSPSNALSSTCTNIEPASNVTWTAKYLNRWRNHNTCQFSFKCNRNK
jgi:hypothetical protein